jgi:hypothetical protein
MPEAGRDQASKWRISLRHSGGSARSVFGALELSRITTLALASAAAPHHGQPPEFVTTAPAMEL